MSSPTDLPPPLDLHAMDADPHREFALWFDHAVAAGIHEPEAIALATAGADGRPSVRMVLLRGAGPEGYVWFTNVQSRKGGQLSENPHAAIVAHWAALGRQIRIEGPVTPATAAVSDAYFASRDRRSQIGAWASHQSEPLTDRAELTDRIAELTASYGADPVPRPAHWGGYVLTPILFEFWQHAANRLHDRILYTPDGDRWRRTRLSP